VSSLHEKLAISRSLGKWINIRRYFLDFLREFAQLQAEITVTGHMIQKY